MIQHRNTRELGQAIERKAERFLLDQGLRLVSRNFRCKAGELDLIMQDGASLVFVEVRFRRNKGYGDGAATVTHHKQQRLIRTAQYYLQTQSATNAPCRFDVISAYQSPDQGLQFDWIRNAIESN